MGVMPDIKAAYAYETEFPNGPFIADVYRTIADFHKDLYMVLRDRLLVGLPEDHHHLLFRESGLLHGSSRPLRAPFSQASTGPKIARQVISVAAGSSTAGRAAVFLIGPIRRERVPATLARNGCQKRTCAP
jgi:hypothetical protein